MLILTRRNKESVIINDDIKIIVLGVNGNQVRLGFEAPDDVTIVREELLEKRKYSIGNHPSLSLLQQFRCQGILFSKLSARLVSVSSIGTAEH